MEQQQRHRQIKVKHKYKMMNAEDPEDLSTDKDCQSGPKESWALRHKPKMVYLVASLFIAACATISITYTVISTNKRNKQAVDMSKPMNLYSQSNALSYFDSSIVTGYPICTDLKNDLENAVKFIVDVRVDVYAKNKFRNNQNWMWIPRGGGFGDVVMETMGEEAKIPVADGAGVGGSGGEDSFGTNNQVDGVDEADLIKSDGEVVYAAYGNQIVIWDATTGIELSRTTLPMEDEDGIEACEDDQSISFIKNSPLTSNEKEKANCYTVNFWNKMRISSFLIHEQRLVAVASAPFYLGKRDDEQVLDGYHSTRVFTYDISSIPTDKSSLSLLARKDLQGSYQTARSIDNIAHIVTNSNVRTWYFLDQHLDPWHSRYEGMLENEYRQAAYDYVQPLISIFADKLTEEILYTHDKDTVDDDCSQIAKVALMLRDNKGKRTAEDSILSFTTEGVLNNYVQVHSMDMQEDYSNSNGTITTSHSGVFLPTASYTQNVYSSETKLIISGNAYDQGVNDEWNEMTVLFAFDLTSGTAVADSVGEVPGSVLNQFSMDHYKYDLDGEDYIRVATTTWAKFGIVDDEWMQTTQSTNQVTILKLPSSGTSSSKMEVVGEVNGMGVGERIYAARFIKEVAYVVTFRQVDPFYTLDLTDPRSPQVVGELKIPGFSNYLHPVSDDLVLALGQDADDMGVMKGLQIAMFDVSDISNPQQIHKYVENGYSSSDAQFEHKAFRYLPLSKLLIIPLTIYSYEDYFDGFVVYDVDESKEKFSRSFSISHKDDVETCWDDAFLPSRSLVFDGKVTTTKRHTVLSHDLTTADKIWTLNLDTDRDDAVDSCWYWLY